MRWIWIDKFLTFDRAKEASAVKYLTLAEDHFAQHFPGYPVMPVPLMLEGMAQTGGILVGEARDFKEKVVLAKLSRVNFTDDAVAGQELVYKVKMESLRDEGAVVSGEVFADGKLIGSAEIQFAHLDSARSGQLFGDRNFVFTGELQRMLDLARPFAKG